MGKKLFTILTLKNCCLSEHVIYNIAKHFQNITSCKADRHAVQKVCSEVHSRR